MPAKALPSQSFLQSVLRYDPETGSLFWRERTEEMIESASRRAAWNTKYATKEAFTVVHGRGYRCGYVEDRQYLAHRIIWKMVHGQEPEQIDHINGVRTDNRLANLRAADNATNTMNSAKYKNNTSGVTGVSKGFSAGKWLAYISVDGHRVSLGTHDSFEAAAAARKAAEITYNYHPNHGRDPAKT